MKVWITSLLLLVTLAGQAAPAQLEGRVSRVVDGDSLWLELPEGFSSAQLFGDALAQGIRIAPGSMFSNSGRYEHCMRLACTHPVDATMDKAMQLLGSMACRQLGQAPRGA